MILNFDNAAGSGLANDPLAVVPLDRFLRSRPWIRSASASTLSTRPAGGNRREPIARKWAAIHSLGSDLVYDLSEYYPKSTGKRYELRFNISSLKAR